MTKTTIADTRVRLRPSNQLLQLLDEHKAKFTEVPENIAKALRAKGYKIPSEVEISTKETVVKRPKIDITLLRELIKDIPSPTLPETQAESSESEGSDSESTTTGETSSTLKQNIYLYLADVHWVNDFLTQLRQDNNCDVFLHEVLQTCELVLPENEIIPRNPELEARCQRLRAQQENYEYQKMTKNVDSMRQKFPEDTISYQIKAINKQLVAVFQFVVSVVTGFVFGFWGLQLMFGNLQFGLRLILGIIFALIIALAEMYFLAVKLNEYDTVVDAQNPRNSANDKKSKPRKAHID